MVEEAVSLIPRSDQVQWIGQRRDFVATFLPVPLRLNRPTKDSCNVRDVGPIKRSGSGGGVDSWRRPCRFRCA